MENDLPEAVKKCLDILEENVEILANLEYDLNDEDEDELATECNCMTFMIWQKMFLNHLN